MSPAALTDSEAKHVVELIRPCFDKYVARFNERKYPSAVYEELLRVFGTPQQARDYIGQALHWKYGNFEKENSPTSHKALIKSVQEIWSEVSFSGLAAEVFRSLDAKVDGKKRYITVSFLLHLLRPKEIPIIDQHNFRAMNHYFKTLRREWRSKSKPSTYNDLTTLSSFLNSIRTRWKTSDKARAPSERKLDRFLMMYGKELKKRKQPSTVFNRA
ncbi:MAG TPA: hypothetical protein VNF49_01675 [Candidatus Binataceae bacterium]|nr:hypothetical protein [Candidatus Binataceae bacterium]